MPFDCTVCADQRLETIHQALDAGGGVNKTARAFDISPTTLKRHVAHRAAPRTTKAKRTAPTPAVQPARPPKGGPGRPESAHPKTTAATLERVRELAERAERLAAESEEGTIRERAACMNAAKGVLELLAKLSPDPEIKLLESEAWANLKGATLTALERFPDALEAVVEAWEAFASGS